MAIALPQQVFRFTQRYNLLRSGQHLLVAVSGGADSVALIHVLYELRRRMKLRLTVAHFNHKIRGKDAEEDACFVRQLAGRLRVDVAVATASVPCLAKRLGISLEMAGRKARYGFFEKTALACGCDAVITAHTSDDNAETILLMLVRGCGMRGLTGIPPLGKMGEIMVARPLLETSREAIEKYLRERDITWREDVSNADPAFLRNRVRHELLPLLEAGYNKNIRETLNRVGGVLRVENDFIERFAEKAYSETRAGSKQNFTAINAESLSKYHGAIRRRVLRRWLLTNGIDNETIDFQLINGIDNLMTKPGGEGRMLLAGGVRIEKNYQWLTSNSIERRRKKTVGNCQIKIPGTTSLPESGLCVKAAIGPGVCRARGAFGKYPARASLSLKKWRRRVIRARAWRAGDRVRPHGLAGSKKIQDIFGDAKVPVALRHCLPIFECGKEIIWLPGYRVAKGWEVSKGEDKALQFKVEFNLK